MGGGGGLPAGAANARHREDGGADGGGDLRLRRAHRRARRADQPASGLGVAALDHGLVRPRVQPTDLRHNPLRDRLGAAILHRAYADRLYHRRRAGDLRALHATAARRDHAGGRGRYRADAGGAAVDPDARTDRRLQPARRTQRQSGDRLLVQPVCDRARLAAQLRHANLRRIRRLSRRDRLGAGDYRRIFRRGTARRASTTMAGEAAAFAALDVADHCAGRVGASVRTLQSALLAAGDAAGLQSVSRPGALAGAVRAGYGDAGGVGRGGVDQESTPHPRPLSHASGERGERSCEIVACSPP